MVTTRLDAALHLQEELSEDSPSNKVLIIAPHNQALDDYELGFKRTLEKHGAPPKMFPRTPEGRAS